MKVMPLNWLTSARRIEERAMGSPLLPCGAFSASSASRPDVLAASALSALGRAEGLGELSFSAAYTCPQVNFEVWYRGLMMSVHREL